MWKQRGGRSSVLDKAMARLAAKRPTSGGLKLDEMASPLKCQGRRIEFQGLSDISSEDSNSDHHDYKETTAPRQDKIPEGIEDPEEAYVGGGSRFLKKPTNAIPERQRSAPMSQRLAVEDPGIVPQRRPQSAALNRLAQFEQRFRQRQAAGGSSHPQPSSPAPPSPPEAALLTHSSSDLSMTGARFLKKKMASTPREERKQAAGPPAPSRAAMLRPGTKGVSLDSDEEDMKKLLGGSLNSSSEGAVLPEKGPTSTQKTVEVSSTSIRRSPEQAAPSEQASPVASQRSVSIVYSPSPSPPHTQPSFRSSPRGRTLRPSHSRSSASAGNEIKSLDELFTDSDDTVSERSAASIGFKLNIMTLEDLVPADPLGRPSSSNNMIGTSPDQSWEEDVSQAASERTLDDLFPDAKGSEEEEAVNYESDFESQVDSDASQRSVSDIPEHLSHDDALTEEDQSNKQRRHSPLAQHSDSEHSTHSHRSEAYHSRSYTPDGRMRTDSSSRSSNSSRSDTLTPTSPPRRPHVKEAAVQTEKRPAFTWTPGIERLETAYVDPVPIAQYTVSAETLNALSTQKPVEAALTDMLRQQLSLTRRFIESSRHIYCSLLQALGQPDYRYTTLEDTKEYIRKHRRRQLTVEEALEEVHREMKEYHYI